LAVYLVDHRPLPEAIDPTEELERMALNAVADSSLASDAEPSHDEVARGERLFYYSDADAADLIKQHRSDIARARVTDKHWDLIRSEKEASVYDREAYEHDLQLGKETGRQPTERATRAECSEPGTNVMYIFKFGGPLAEDQQVQTAAASSLLPELVIGIGEQEVSNFCREDAAAKRGIKEWLFREQISYEPTFIQLSKARKEVSCMSSYPMLGQDSTLPQYRQTSNEPVPAQYQYPV